MRMISCCASVNFFESPRVNAHVMSAPRPALTTAIRSSTIISVEPPRAPDLAPECERLPDLDPDLRPHLRARDLSEARYARRGRRCRSWRHWTEPDDLPVIHLAEPLS